MSLLLMLNQRPLREVMKFQLLMPWTEMMTCCFVGWVTKSTRSSQHWNSLLMFVLRKWKLTKSLKCWLRKKKRRVQESWV